MTSAEVYISIYSSLRSLASTSSNTLSFGCFDGSESGGLQRTLADFGGVWWILVESGSVTIFLILLCLPVFSLFLEVSHGAATLTHFSLTHIAATLLTHSTAVVLTHSIAILIALPHWCIIYSGQSCRLFFS